jgi:hypothetical protein
MKPFITTEQAFKSAAKNLCKLPGAGSLSACQTILAKATGHRDLHHAQALQAQRGSVPIAAPSATPVEILTSLEKAMEGKVGPILNALQKARFFGPKMGPKEALIFRADLFSKEFPATSQEALGSPCITTEGGAARRALLISRGKDESRICKAMTDHGIVTCVGSELVQHRTGVFFIPEPFYKPYGVWTEKDGSKVVFSRDYCPLWKIQEGRAPIQDDPNRWVHFTDQKWFSDKGTVTSGADLDRKRGLEILQEYRVVSVPKLVEWLPECLKQGKCISKFKKWPHSVGEI